MLKKLAVVGILSLAVALPAFAQNVLPANTTPVQLTHPQYFQVPISATAAVNTQVTLTIPAPPANLTNYVCSLTFNASHSATGAILNNQVTTSTNFNSFAIKFSVLAVATQAGYDWVSTNWGSPSTGCVKSTLPGTATTFVSPAAAAQTAFAWTASYYQAP